MTEEYAVPGGWSDPDGLITAIVSAVAEVRGEEADDLEPMFAVVDPDALERVFRPLLDEPGGDSAVHIQFTYAGCDVLVRRDEIVVRPAGGT